MEMQNLGASLGNCGNCGYAARSQRIDKVDCARYPPPQLDGAGKGIFPMMDTDDWCGEWASAGRVAAIITERERRVPSG